jgi:hypothetical protein
MRAPKNSPWQGIRNFLTIIVLVAVVYGFVCLHDTCPQNDRRQWFDTRIFILFLSHVWLVCLFIYEVVHCHYY